MKEEFKRKFDLTILFTTGILTVIGLIAIFGEFEIDGINMVKVIIYIYQFIYWRKDINYKAEYLGYYLGSLILWEVIIGILLWIIMQEVEKEIFPRVIVVDESMSLVLGVVSIIILIIDPIIKSWLYQHFKKKSYRVEEQKNKEN